jgi:hypothetical protein
MGKKPHQINPADPQCHVINQRMRKQTGLISQISIKKKLNFVIWVIDKRKRADRAGAYTQHFKQPIGTAK